MGTKNLISVQLICNHYNIPVSFIDTLNEFQLVDIIIENKNLFIHKSQLKEVEKLMRIHYDLEINFEGLDAIYNLLNQVESLKEEITLLQNKLRFYEDL
ncbi:chaperone modulator CbpM [Gaetbulibacter aquiaggeris]|uniref:Chaperone modulator CbpM n=1 Tax=Gaetbulibacter aquiaggeris TaxID=1735373 RepID=A0ABW7MQG7_9FLAO